MANHSGIYDSSAKLQIIPHTRQISVPATCKIIGTVGDHLSEQVTFQCPKEIDGHDIKGCAEHFVTWRTVDEEIGHDGLELIDEDDECLYFAWTVRGQATTQAGIVAFSVHFEDYSSEGKRIYRWSTTECRECEVLDAVNAPMGTYELIYVDDQTLVIADQTLVRDEALLLETNGVVPSGTKFIDTNGHYNVVDLVSVDVAVPNDKPISLTVDADGRIVATDGTPQNTVEHKLSIADDPHFSESSILSCRKIFGVAGTAHIPTCIVQIDYSTFYGYIEYLAVEDSIRLVFKRVEIEPHYGEGGSISVEAVMGSCLRFDGGFNANAFKADITDIDGELYGDIKGVPDSFAIRNGNMPNSLDPRIEAFCGIPIITGINMTCTIS